jgi:hypothetical protein
MGHYEYYPGAALLGLAGVSHLTSQSPTLSSTLAHTRAAHAHKFMHTHARVRVHTGERESERARESESESERTSALERARKRAREGTADSQLHRLRLVA